MVVLLQGTRMRKSGRGVAILILYILILPITLVAGVITLKLRWIMVAWEVMKNPEPK